MKTTLIKGLFWLATGLIINGIAAQDLRTELEKIIRYDTDISYSEIPGFVIGIVDGDSIFIEGFGSTTLTSSTPPDENTTFEIGGLTKVFTALLCQILHDNKTFNLDSSMNTYIDQDVRNSALSHITPRHLLTHTSGLPYLPDNFASKEIDPGDRYAYYEREDLKSYLLSINKAPEIERYLYSHLNYAVIEWLVESHLNQPFESLLDQYILNKFQMDATYLGSRDKSSITPGFGKSGAKVSDWHFASFAASEGLRSTASDLCRFAQQLLLDSSNVSESIQQMLIPEIKIPTSRRSYTALGWHMMMGKKNNRIYLHSGKTTGHGASIHFIKQTGTAVILMTNSPGRMDGLAILVLRMINDNWKRKF